MKKYTWLVLLLSFALLAGCGKIDDPAPTATPDRPAQSTPDPEPVESEPADGINPEPPALADRKPVENREPAVIVEPKPAETPAPQEPVQPEQEREPVPVPSPDIEIVPVRADAEFCGEWFSREKDSSGEVRALKLVLEDDGTAYFNYGVPYGEVLEAFEGRWREEGTNLVLDLYGGPVADDGTYDYDYCRDLDAYFRWEMQGVALVCEPAGGGTLLKGTGGEWYTFRPFDAFKLSGTWCSGDGCLQLKENGGCIYSVTDANGSLLAEYSGTWRYKDGQLSLSMTMNGGSRYDAGERGQIAGNYREEYSAADELVLTHISGSAINESMENGSSVIFKKQ